MTKTATHAPKQARRKALLARLARVEGQIRAVRRMIEEDKPCESVAQQLAASKTALNKAFCEMMASAIEQEVTESCALGQTSQQRLATLTDLLTRYG